MEIPFKAQSYTKDHCWQYDIRLQNLQEDLKQAGLSAEEVAGLKVTDFEFSYVDDYKKVECRKIKNFILRHEWLGKMPTRPTHRFIATYKGHLAGVVIMATPPNSFSYILGSITRDTEKVISRGACISWSPKNLGSALVMFSIRWMSKRTQFHFFIAYSDVEARELGTIYQACNFIYLGQNAGARKEYFDSERYKMGWFSDRIFRRINMIKYYAKRAGVDWQPEWSENYKVLWDKIPNLEKKAIRRELFLHRDRCSVRVLPLKHKYAFILGRNKRHTKELKKIFTDRNPHFLNIPYPKYREPQTNTAAKINVLKEEILTEQPTTCRPQAVAKDYEFLNAKEASKLLGVSVWTIYKLIAADSHFPFHNVGVKKKFVINRWDLLAWMEFKKKNRILEMQKLPSGQDLLKLKGA